MTQSTRFGLSDIAEQGGVEAGFVADLVRLGLVASGDDGEFGEADVRTVKLLRTLEDAGVPMEGVAEAVREGILSFDFLHSWVYQRLAMFEDVTFAELSEETGVPVDLLVVIREVIGSAVPQPDDRVRADEMLIVPFVRFVVNYGVDPRGVERLLRVYGDNLRRITESEADWWHNEMLPALGSDFEPLQTLEAADELPGEATRWSDEAVMAIYHAQQGHAWTKSMIESVEVALEGAGLHSRLEKIPAISFLDITGYTRMTEEQGDEAAADLADTLNRTVQRISARHGGEPVKRLGDGVMLHFPDPGAGVLAALEMVDGVAAAGLPRAHVGVHAGPLLFQDGDYYGRTVNIASRITDYARPGEVLVSQAVREASDNPGIDFVEVGPVELKGVSEPTRLWVAQNGG